VNLRKQLTHCFFIAFLDVLTQGKPKWTDGDPKHGDIAYNLLSNPLKPNCTGASANVSVKALARGLDVLAAVNELNPGAVKDVVESTGLPKATAIRLLKSLVEQGYLAEDSEGQGYRVTSDVRKLSRALSTQTRYAQIAEPLLRDLSIAIKFPAIFGVLDGASLLIEADSKRTAPLKIKLFERTRIPLLAASSGYAVLAELDKPRRDALIDHASSLITDPAKLQSREDIDRGIDSCIQRGYAYQPVVEGIGVSAIAVAVKEKGEAIGSVTIPFFNEIVHESVVNTLLLPRLRETADSISHALDADGPVAPTVSVVAVG